MQNDNQECVSRHSAESECAASVQLQLNAEIATDEQAAVPQSVTPSRVVLIASAPAVQQETTDLAETS